MSQSLLALAKPLLALLGVFSGFTAALFAAAGDPSGALAPWAQVGGTVTAVSCLAYMATLLASGKLVSVKTADLLREGAEREKTVIALAQSEHDMNERMWRRWGDVDSDRARDRRQDNDR